MRRHRLSRRYGHAKRSEGVRVKRQHGRLYFVSKGGEVMSVPMKNK